MSVESIVSKFRFEVASVRAYFCALRKSMADGQLGHVVPLLTKRNEVVVDASLVLAGVVEIELLGLDVVFAQLLLLEFGDFFEETLFFFHRHAPEDDNTVFEEKNFGDVDGGVEVGCHRALNKGV